MVPNGRRLGSLPRTPDRSISPSPPPPLVGRGERRRRVPGLRPVRPRAGRGRATVPGRGSRSRMREMSAPRSGQRIARSSSVTSRTSSGRTPSSVEKVAAGRGAQAEVGIEHGRGLLVPLPCPASARGNHSLRPAGHSPDRRSPPALRRGDGAADRGKAFADHSRRHRPQVEHRDAAGLGDTDGHARAALDATFGRECHHCIDRPV